MKNKSALILFLGNIKYDSRCMNLYKSLKERGYEVKVVGFDWLTEDFESVKDEISIYRLRKKNLSLTFYLKFSVVMTYRLLFSRYSICFAEDIYTLPFACIANFFKRGKIIYDSRELFGYLAGLTGRKIIQRLLRLIEKTFIRRAYRVVVTGDMDAEFIKNEYGINNIIVVRNLPFYKKIDAAYDFRGKYGIDEKKKILLYQGMIHHGRGLKIMFDQLKNTDKFVLVILGHGDNYEYYKNLSVESGIDKKVIFAGKVGQENLLNYTAGADAGISLIENISLSYYYALPNKLFEYIAAGIPVIASNLPQMKRIIEEYKVGIIVDPSDAVSLSAELRKFYEDEAAYAEFKKNCAKAAEELNWQKEIENLFSEI